MAHVQNRSQLDEMKSTVTKPAVIFRTSAQMLADAMRTLEQGGTLSQKTLKRMVKEVQQIKRSLPKVRKRRRCSN
jgi:hypothetical protein